jgi:hypothetical protein
VNLLVRLGLLRGAPSEKTIRRTLQRLDADTLDAAISAWMWLRAGTIGGVRVISFDGKTSEVPKLSEGCRCTRSTAESTAAPSNRGSERRKPMPR